jgi:exosortase
VTGRSLSSDEVLASTTGDGGRAVDASPRLQPSWRSAVTTLGCCCAVLAFLQRDVIAATWASWSTDPLGHGYAVVPGALYLAWIRRRQLSKVAPAPAVLPLLLLGVLWMLWSQADLAGTGLGQQCAVIVAFIGFAWAVLGAAAARVLSPSLAFLFFALPLGRFLVPVLQDATAGSVAATLALTGLDVSRAGRTIVLPASIWRVAEACSGINYLVASLMAGYVYAFATYRGAAHRITFVLAAALIAVLGNALRVYGTILMGVLGYPALVAGTTHYVFGWVVFSLMLFALIALFGRWPEKRTADRCARRPSDAG